MKTKTLAIILFTFVTFVIKGNESKKLFRWPAISPNGNTIAFSYQGDIWKVSARGGEAIRLTVHNGYEYAPRFSPDGTQIAFSGNRFGNDDIFTIPLKGGTVKRVTYHSARDVLCDWSESGKLIFETSREFRQPEWDYEIYSAPANGGTPSRFLNAVGYMATESPNGRFVAFVRGACRIARESYKGPANKDIWLYDSKHDKYIKLTTYEGNDFYPQWADNKNIYFISSRNGRYNIFKITIDTDGNVAHPPTAITHYSDDGIRYFNLSASGKYIVFERQTDIYYLNLEKGTPHKVKIDLSADFKHDPILHRSFSSKMRDYVVSPNGKLIAFVVHGEIFVKENKKGKSKSVNISNSPFRDLNPQWLSDSTLIFTSDRNGQYDIYLVKSDDPRTTNLFRSLKFKIERLTDTEEDESELSVSPNRKKLVYLQGNSKLISAIINTDGTLSDKTVLLNGWATPSGIAWSPDSKWLAYALEDLDFNSDVFIISAEGGEPVNVSMHPKGDYSPVWSPDGSKLAFLSERHNNDRDVWFVWLRKKDWERSKADWEELEDLKTDKSKKEKKKKNISVKIDFDNIYERLVQVTSFPGDEGNIAISKDGNTFYFTAIHPPSKGSDLFSAKWDGTKLKALTSGGINPYDIKTDRQGKYLYFLKSGGRLGKLNLKSSKTENISFQARMDINFKAEKNQIFEEAWRALRDGFYDPQFHGRNWDALRKKYKPRCMAASTDRDFRYMFNVMLGQLDASHMGMRGGKNEETQRESFGLLGAEFTPTAEGLKVVRVIPDSPADKEFSKLNAGDVIREIDGNPYNRKENFYKYLINKVNNKVLLSVVNKDGEEREVIIRPVKSLRDLLYKEWVRERKRLTDKYSHGRLGYIHIRGMNWSSFEEFQRDLMASGYGKEGIVIDVRFNGGGWTTDYLMTVLNVRQHAYTIPRGAAKTLAEHKKFRDYYPYSERLPYAPWTKPSIAMCNAESYSNAEIFSHAYKTLGIGTLVGEPTFGAVISTGAKNLIDGSYVRMPFRAWYVKATDKNMEHGPAVPQIIIYNNPDDKAKGRDTQLKAAVNELLKEIDSRKK